jgi:hypothetical protein
MTQGRLERHSHGRGAYISDLHSRFPRETISTPAAVMKAGILAVWFLRGLDPAKSRNIRIHEVDALCFERVLVCREQECGSRWDLAEIGVIHVLERLDSHEFYGPSVNIVSISRRCSKPSKDYRALHAAAIK